jgi:hypothetical protein
MLPEMNTDWHSGADAASIAGDVEAVLRAEGLLMSGDRVQAVAAAEKALRLIPREKNAVNWRYAAAVAARVFAWAGAKRDAVELLAQLSVSQPGLSRVEIARDSLYSAPLEGQVGFRQFGSSDGRGYVGSGPTTVTKNAIEHRIR